MLFFIPVLSPGQEKALKQYGFRDNWNIQAQFGGRYMISSGEFGELLTPTIALTIGKEFCPAIGTRIALVGASNRDWGTFENDYYKWNSLEAYLDVLFNFNKLFCRYKEDRLFAVTGIMGLGYGHGFKNEPIADFETNNAIGRVGLQVRFRLNKSLNLNLEGTINATTDAFDSKISVGEKTSKYDAWVNAMLGISYRFRNHDGSRKFALVNTADAAEIKLLNDKINEQQTIIASHKPCPEAKPEPEILQPAPPAKETILLDAVVIFGLGKSDITPNQETTIYNVARFMKENPDLKIGITGYADAQTGNTEINQLLSEKRVATIARELIHKYGIAAERIRVDSKGSSIQPYRENSWNRVVIMVTE